MIGKEQVSRITERFFTGSDKFLVDINILPGNRISVYIDGDKGINIDDCRDLSRFIEKNLDRDLEDFELNVSSYGIDRPLILYRQYVKNIGRQFEIITHTGEKISGKLLQTSKEGIDLIQDVVEKKKIVGETIVPIPFSNIKSAKLVIRINK
jgi:ribosome maturation factor RimP